MASHLDGAVDHTIRQRLVDRITTVQMDSGKAADYRLLTDSLKKIEADSTTKNRLMYLSVPPAVALPVISAMEAAGIKEGADATRLMLEKPFGYNLKSAEELEDGLKKVFKEEEIYRIDHYVSKEAAQNLTVFRFKNPIIKALWSNEYIDHIEIDVSEKIGIEGRADFFEQTGALRDFIQSHHLALMSLTMMEEPQDGATEVHRRRLDLINSIIPVSDFQADTLRGQYRGYREEVNNPNSTTETFAAVRLQVNNARWKNVPVILQAGKKLDHRCAEIRIHFKHATTDEVNRIIFRLQPSGGITFELVTKKPGLTDATHSVGFDHTFEPHEQSLKPEAYDRVIFDAMRGDRTSFTTGEEVLATWRLINPILEHWSKSADDLVLYEPGSTGPSFSSSAK